MTERNEKLGMHNPDVERIIYLEAEIARLREAPHRCPVCGGTGLVPNGWYGAIGTRSYSTSSVTPEPCQSCNGSGILWHPSEEETGD
jgi:hypothetical protein